MPRALKKRSCDFKQIAKQLPKRSKISDVEGGVCDKKSYWKELGIPSKVVKLLPARNICVFCRCAEDCQTKYGEFLCHSLSGISLHYFCMLFASGLTQAVHGEEIDDSSIEKESICGFLIKDVVQEVKRASRLRCVYCHQLGASIGCVLSFCKTKFHFSCGLNNGILSQFYQNFKSYCPRHRPKQSCINQCVLSSNATESDFGIQENESKNHQQNKFSDKSTTSDCPVCLEPVHCSYSNFQSLSAPCCWDVWLHRTCVQQQAFSSGLHFFRCPVCNNSKLFLEEMQRMGVYVPERDASWELTHDAFSELLQRHNRCDMEECKCPYGRDYNLHDSKWAVVLCDLCGSNGTHIACCEAVESEQSYHACYTCTDIHGDEGARDLAVEMGVLSRAPLRQSCRIRNNLSKQRRNEVEFPSVSEVKSSSSSRGNNTS